MRRVFCCILWFCLLISTVAFAAEEKKIEQVYVNKPNVVTYFRTDGGTDEISASLNGEELSLEGVEPFAATGEGVDYYILLDVSASIPGSRIQDIKNSIIQMVNEKRDKDRILLTTFGSEVKTVLNGKESKDEAVEKINAISDRDQKTLLFDALNMTADSIWKANGKKQKRRVVFTISDGKDCADDTRSADSIQATYISKGIPMYTFAVENNEGDSEGEISSYRGRFSSIARSTGGLAWTASSSNTSVLEGFTAAQDAIMNSYKGSFKAVSNKVSNTEEPFVLHFSKEQSDIDNVSILVSRREADDTVPWVVNIESTEEKNVTIEFSKPMMNAGDPGNYRVTRKDKTIAVNQVIVEDDNQRVVTLVMESELLKGEYTIEINNVYDQSDEKHPLQDNVLTFESDWKPSLLSLILKWWPLLLTLLLLLLIITTAIVLKTLKNKKNVIVVGDQVIDVESKQEFEQRHVRMSNQQNMESKPLTVWIMNGRDQPKSMRYNLINSAIVGRARQCDIYCDDNMMSKQHFVLELQNNNIFITDLNSTNGTSVNGIRIRERHQLFPRDEITAGNLTFRIEWN